MQVAMELFTGLEEKVMGNGLLSNVNVVYFYATCLNIKIYSFKANIDISLMITRIVLHFILKLDSYLINYNLTLMLWKQYVSLLKNENI